MYKNDFTAAGKYQVGMARQIAAVQSISKTHLMNQLADEQFRLCVFGTNQTHPYAPFLGAEAIHLHRILQNPTESSQTA